MVAEIITALAVGLGLPIMTCANTQLKRCLDNPIQAALVSFSVGLAALSVLTLFCESGADLHWDACAEAPGWIWAGGVCGVIYTTGNIVLMQRLGSVQTVILPALGQTLTALAIDSFGLFGMMHVQLTGPRGLGAAAVVAGVVLFADSSPQNKAGILDSRSQDRLEPPYADDSPQHGALWLWRIAGIVTGSFGTLQIAANAQLAAVLGSPLHASVFSFASGAGILLAAFLLMGLRGVRAVKDGRAGHWWMWTGGFFAAFCVLSNIYIAPAIGTGMNVLLVLIGQVVGGLVVDTFGLLGASRRPLTMGRVAALCVMAAGAVLVHIA